MRTAVAATRAALIQRILPERQRALGSGGGADGAGDEAPKPSILRLLEHLATAHAGEDHGLYHDGGTGHSCKHFDVQ
jgi:hypothetical protein